MRYAIMVDYYVDMDENGNMITMPTYFGTKGVMKIFIFEEEQTENTRYFNTKKEAQDYIDKYLDVKETEDGFIKIEQYENIRIVEV